MSTAIPLTAGGYLRRVVTSSLGAKVIMAVSGLAFYGWLALHLLGNLSIFAGAETMNEYAHFLQSKPELLWAQRIVLIAVVATHAAMGIRLSMLNRAARPQDYRSPRNWRQASLASRTMAVSGAGALAFLLFHLAHFTGGVVQPESYAGTHLTAARIPDVYGMVKAAFENPLFAGLYVVALAGIGFHLSHAVWSATQTLGLNGPKWTPVAKRAGLAVGVGLAGLFSLIPLAGLLGLLK